MILPRSGLATKGIVPFDLIKHDLIKSRLIKSNGTIPFVAKPLLGKAIIKSGLDFED